MIPAGATRQGGVVYLGDTLKVCFLEAVLRDRRDGLVGDLPIDEKEIYARRYQEVGRGRAAAASTNGRDADIAARDA